MRGADLSTAMNTFINRCSYIDMRGADLSTAMNTFINRCSIVHTCEGCQFVYSYEYSFSFLSFLYKTFSNYKHFKMNISVHAPVLFLPLGDETVQCLMIDLGNLSLRNALKAEPDTAERVAVDEYTISLTSFKVSRYVCS